MKYAAVVTHDNAGSYALAIAAKKADNSVVLVDSNHSTAQSIHLNEALNALISAGYTAQLTEYPNNLLAHAQSDALALAATL